MSDTETRRRTMAKQITVVAGAATPADDERGVDVDFRLSIGGEEHAGSVTLLPHEDGRPGYGSWGSLDHWLDSATCRLLRDLDQDDYEVAIDTIRGECAEAASCASDAEGKS
jgi:hypothetical protein